MRLDRCVFVAASLLAGGGAVGGPVTYVDQDRSVRGSLSFPGAPPDLEIASTAGGLFDESVSHLGFNDDTGDFASASASQLSTLGMNGVTMSGHVQGFGSVDALGTGRSRLETTFVLDESSGFTFDAALLGLSLSKPTFQFRATLEEFGGAMVFDVNSAFEIVPDSGDFFFDPVAGTLGAGTYTLVIEVHVSGLKSASSEFGYDAALRIPGPWGVGVWGVGGVLASRRRRRA